MFLLFYIEDIDKQRFVHNGPLVAGAWTPLSSQLRRKFYIRGSADNPPRTGFSCFRYAFPSMTREWALHRRT